MTLAIIYVILFVVALGYTAFQYFLNSNNLKAIIGVVACLFILTLGYDTVITAIQEYINGKVDGFLDNLTRS